MAAGTEKGPKPLRLTQLFHSRHLDWVHWAGAMAPYLSEDNSTIDTFHVSMVCLRKLVNFALPNLIVGVLKHTDVRGEILDFI